MQNLTDKINKCSEEGIEWLPDVVKYNGYCYYLVERTLTKSIYAQHDINHPLGFEVFKTQITDRHRIQKKFGKEVKGAKYLQKFPSVESFGKWSWTCATLQEAKRRYGQLE